MTSVVGLDVGSLASKIGLARNRGIDIITNEVSNRATPALVAFGPRNRTIGESAKTQETSNFKNTVGSLKRLIGRTASDTDVTSVESKYLNAELCDVKGTVGVRVQYLGEQTEFSATQLYAAYLAHLRDIAAVELKNTVNDVVIAVPGWYTDIQRRAVLDAAEIANLHPLRLINETTAIALGYGITKTDLPGPEEKPRIVAFVDIGHSQYQVAIVQLIKGALQVKAYTYDHHFGGRDIDYALVLHFAAEFKEKYKIDVLSNKKAVFRLAAAVEKLKKVLSANAQAPLSVESIMNDIDASSSLKREEFETLLAPLLERVTLPLERALAQAGISKEAIDTVELVGGSTRVPALKSRIQEFFGRPLSYTCNPEESAARGSTLACATMSPVFRVREFAISDIANYPVIVEWEPTPEDSQTTLPVIAADSPAPSGKLLSFHRSQPFELVARYSEPDKLPGGINPHICRYAVKAVTPRQDGGSNVIKLKAKVTMSGTFQFDGAQIHEEIETPGESQAEPAPAETTEGETKEPAKPKRKIIKKDVAAVFMSSSMEKVRIDEYMAQEGQMHANDKLVKETEDKKNSLEEYIYDARGKVDGLYAPFVDADTKQKFKAQLQAAEDWLYSEEGEDATKSAYTAKLDELLKVGGPAQFRQRETEERPHAERALREAIGDFMQKATGGHENYSHISDSDKEQAIEKCAAAEKWIGDMSAKQAERKKTDDPAVTSAEILKRRDDLIYGCTPIFNKPKPKAPAPSSTPAETNANANTTSNSNQTDTSKGDQGPDVDMEGAPPHTNDNAKDGDGKGSQKEAMDVD